MQFTTTRYTRSTTYTFIHGFLLSITLITLIYISLFYITYGDDVKEFMDGMRYDRDAKYCQYVDVVYLWSNGTSALSHYDESTIRSYGYHHDYETLKYSIRSLEKYMPWRRYTILITDGSIPSWLNASTPSLITLTHTQLGLTPPIHNRAALESSLSSLNHALNQYFISHTHIYDTPHDTQCFFYLNEDTLLMNYIRLRDYVDPQTGAEQVVLLDRPVPALPPFRSPSTSDLETESSTTRSYLNSLVFTGHLINTFYHSTAAIKRKMNPVAAIQMDIQEETSNDVIIPHHHYMVGQDCAFFQMRIIETIARRWNKELSTTALQSLRTDEDVIFPFLYSHVSLEEYHGIRSSRHNYEISLHANHAMNQKEFAKIQKLRPHCVYLHDRLYNEKMYSTKERKKYHEALVGIITFMSDLFPIPSIFENKQPGTSPVAHMISAPVLEPTLFHIPFTSIHLFSLSTFTMRILIAFLWFTFLSYIILTFHYYSTYGTHNVLFIRIIHYIIDIIHTRRAVDNKKRDDVEEEHDVETGTLSGRNSIVSTPLTARKSPTMTVTQNQHRRVPSATPSGLTTLMKTPQRAYKGLDEPSSDVEMKHHPSVSETTPRRESDIINRTRRDSMQPITQLVNQMTKTHDS